MEKPVILICDCSNAEHQLVFRKDEDDFINDPRVVYCNVHLTPRPFWQRVENAIKYIFGHRSNYGEFQEILLTRQHVEELKDLVNYLENERIVNSSSNNNTDQPTLN